MSLLWLSTKKVVFLQRTVQYSTVQYSEEGTGRGPRPSRPLLAVPNVTAHLSTASVPITVLLCNRPCVSVFCSRFVCWLFHLTAELLQKLVMNFNEIFGRDKKR